MLVGLGVRLAFGLGYWLEKPLTNDEREHLALARSIATGSGFVYPPASTSTLPQERFSRAPVYPAFVALIGGHAVTGADPASSPATVKIAQSVVGSIGVLLIGALSWRVGGPVAGATAAVVAAVYPPLVWICAYVLSEALYSTLALSTVLVFGAAVDERAMARDSRWAAGLVLLSGVLGGLAALTRPLTLVFLVLASFWLATYRPRHLAALLVVGALVTIGPWTVRNIREHQRFIIVSAQGGANFWIGNHLLARGEGDMAANPAIKQANLEFRRRHVGLTVEELEPLYYSEAVAHLIEHPVWWFGLLARKFFFLWVPIGPSYTLRSARYMWASVLSYLLILPFAVAGVVQLWMAQRVPVALFLMAGSVVLTSVLFFPQERYRIPVLDPTFIVCAAVWGGERISRMRREPERR